MIGWAVLLAQGCQAWAATNDKSDDFKLRPPRGTMAPTFWEQNASWIIPMGIAGLAALALLVWYFTRPRPVSEIPPEVRARKELEVMAARPIDREVLSRASQILKRYIAEVLGLPKEEMTTSEFARALKDKPEFSGGLADQVNAFLRKNDELKFNAGSSIQANLVAEAITLVEAIEKRRGELRSNSPAAPDVASERIST